MFIHLETFNNKQKKNQDEKREATPALNYHGDFKSKSRFSQQIFPGDSAVLKD